MRAYAEGTSVEVEKSRAELDKLLAKHGATQRGIMNDDERGIAHVVFTLQNHQYRLEIPLPTLESLRPKKLSDQPPGWGRWQENGRHAWLAKKQEQRSRERWRSVVLLVKAKLEIVQLGLSTVEKEFLADLLLPSGERLHAALGEKFGLALAGSNTPLLGPATAV